MQTALDKARAVASTRATVLLTGETGVGKSVLARLIHDWSDRSGSPFVAVHCGAVPETLLESELFGHEKGAFTGAERRAKGKFELADGGTLFLDEVDTISQMAQVKLLDVLQERCFRRVGGEEDIDVDVRIVAATNTDLDRAQRDGRFRVDLFHRLNVFPIEIPPLRNRTADLPMLTSQMLARLHDLYAKEIRSLDPVVEQAFCRYSWPGNVRELENVLERAYILEATGRISSRHIPSEVLAAEKKQAPPGAEEARTLAEVRRRAVAATEHRYLEELLEAHQGRIDASARAAGITTRQLRKLLAKYGIEKGDYKPHRASRSLPQTPPGKRD